MSGAETSRVKVRVGWNRRMQKSGVEERAEEWGAELKSLTGFPRAGACSSPPRPIAFLLVPNLGNRGVFSAAAFASVGWYLLSC